MGNIYRGSQTTKKIPASSVAPSIPSKYDRVVVSNQEKKGFSSQTKRFPAHICPNENPGPGSYNCVSTVETSGPSYSQKGTTGFIGSKAPRLQRVYPGPNAYNLQGSFINRNDFNTGVSRVFRLPVAVPLDGPKHKTPAPNQYDVRYGRSQRPFSLAGRAPFLSTAGRVSFNPHKDVPSPCHYDVNDTFVQLGSKAVLSPFKSKTQRIQAPVDNQVPGPGAYSPHQAPAPVKRTILPRGCYLAISSPPVMIPKPPPSPGPGHYDVVIYEGPSKHPIPSAAFASRTARILHQPKSDMGPGPGFYDPQILTKQSFFYNDSRTWVPL
ncbi:O(6)-methylguanine-induced apoptosis 2 [Sphaeramia orbicularis]|uniref:O(6)-methylguanine-induced apoptosis 2 n=1 Tax=Sphaeramia orbicularis TaxID=375764 RepID=A0A673BLP3_9TELE|nr:O(6)-methylguanine-induced apoptosis 2 [Sphaeramia orbicularis]